MASTRLTEEHRRTIVNRLIEHRYDKASKAFVAEEHKLAEKVYDREYPVKIQKQMEALPTGLLPEREEIHFHVAGQYHTLTHAKHKRVGAERGNLKLAADDVLAVECFGYWQRKKVHEESVKTTWQEARGVLSSVSTLAKLLQVWPEVESFTKDIGAAGQPVTALAVPIKDLNFKLGLPPDAKAAK